MTLIPDVFPKLQTPKEVVRKMPKNSRLKRPFNKQYGRQSQTLLKSARQRLCDISWCLWRNMSWKKNLFVIFKILGLFVHILSASDKYSVLNTENITQPIHMQLYEFISAFLKCSSNFEHFQQNHDHPNLCISEITDCKGFC